MESLRREKRALERAAKKEGFPLVFERLEFGAEPFRFIESEEKLGEVLSYLLRIGEFGQYAEKMVSSNVYMDLDLFHKEPQFRRTRSALERREIYRRIQKYKDRLRPDYGGRVCLETVTCVFGFKESDAEKYRIMYHGEETYGFIMSNKYILGLLTFCEAARKSVRQDGVSVGHLTEVQQRIALLDGVRDVLFQALLLDHVTQENSCIYVDLCTVLLLD